MDRRVYKKFNKEYLTLVNDKQFPTCVWIVIATLVFLTLFAVYLWQMDDSTPNADVSTKNLSPAPIIEPASPVSKIKLVEEKEKENNQKELERKIKIDFTRRQAIRQAFIHAFNGYKQHAFGFDELRPVSNITNSSWGGFGITLFDALDTMLIMDLPQEYKISREHVLSVNFEKDHDASFFEFTIRYIGGLLGAFELTKDKQLLLKAKEMADKLVWAFNTTTGIPMGIVNMKSHKFRNPSWTQGASLLSEVGSVQLELSYLSHHLGDSTYAEKAKKVIEVLYAAHNDMKLEGLYPVYVNPDNGKFANDLVSYGGLGDSFYEYLIKLYILEGPQNNEANEWIKEMYLQCIEGMIKRLIHKGGGDPKMTYVSEYNVRNSKPIHEMDHLACYVPGMLALGAEGKYEQLHMKLAHELMATCYQLYSMQQTGLGPERVRFTEQSVEIVSPRYLLRPETVESLFVLYRRTHNELYKEWGWKIFMSIEKYLKTPAAYSGIMDVTDPKSPWNNSMQSFFFAETLKYLYLLFSDDNMIPLSKYVFTTEAHPLGIFVNK